MLKLTHEALEFHADYATWRGNQVAFWNDEIITFCLSVEDMENGEISDVDSLEIQVNKGDIIDAIKSHVSHTGTEYE